MGAFKLESNLAVILLIILVVLAGVYFFLDMRKLKLTVENLDKNNEMIVKEIDNIHLQMHKFFSNMPRSIIPESKDYKSSSMVPEVPNVEDYKQTNEEASQEQSLNQEGIEIEKDDTSSSNEEINDSKIINIQDTPRISQDQFQNLKKSSQNNNIFGEIEDFESSNDIMKEEINTDISELLQSTDTVELPPLVPVKYDNDSDNDSVDDEANSDSDDDEVKSSGEDEEDEEDEEDKEDKEDKIQTKINTNNHNHNDKIQEYKKMSVKGLKEKCMEMNLKHSGNKSTLAKRIIDNL